MAYIEGTWHTQIIKAHAEAYRSQYGELRYLEIGVRYAPTFNAVLPFTTEAFGVDPDSTSKTLMDGGTFYHGVSDDFFREYEGPKFDIIFIDGLHTYEQVKKDFRWASTVLLPTGVIFMHDTWPVEKEMESACGDVWQFADELEDDSSWQTYTMRAFPGLTMAQMYMSREL